MWKLFAASKVACTGVRATVSVPSRLVRGEFSSVAWPCELFLDWALMKASYINTFIECLGFDGRPGSCWSDL